MHREGVNSAKERLDQAATGEERLNAIEASVDSLIASTSCGAIAVFTGSRQFLESLEKLKNDGNALAR